MELYRDCGYCGRRDYRYVLQTTASALIVIFFWLGFLVGYLFGVL